MKLKFGLYGLEQHVKVILDGIDKLTDIVDFIAIGSPYTKDQERLKELSLKLGASLYSDYRKMLEDGVDVLGLCIINSEKTPIILDCIKRGIHVVTDKPLCTTISSLDSIEKALREHGEVKLSMLLTLRGTPTYMAVKRIFEKSIIGFPVSIYAKRAFSLRAATRPRWLFDWRRSGGIIVELAVHDVDFVNWLVRTPIEEIRGYHKKVRQEVYGDYQDYASIFMRFKSGTIAFIEVNRLVPESVGSDCRLHITASNGVVKIEKDKVIVLTDEGEREMTNLPDPINVFADFMESLKKDRKPLISTNDVLEVTRITLKARAYAVNSSHTN